jgi:cytochrome c
VEVRLGSPTGKLIGQTAPVAVKDPVMGPPPAAAAPANGSKPATPPAAAGGGQRRQMGQQAVAKIEATNGFQDVYFVFKNSNAQPNQILMSVSTIQFQNTTPNL